MGYPGSTTCPRTTLMNSELNRETLSECFLTIHAGLALVPQLLVNDSHLIVPESPLPSHDRATYATGRIDQSSPDQDLLLP
jgi:hypothetical protein